MLDRFSQIKPKVVFSVESVRYNGRTHDHLSKLASVIEGLPDVCRVVIQPFCGDKGDIDISSIPKRSILLITYCNLCTCSIVHVHVT